MRILEKFVNRHPRGFARIYRAFRGLLKRLEPVIRTVGYDRAEKLLAPPERLLKSLFFGCQMCGICTLSFTGLTCPMRCPKQLRNGPCGGIREDGSCELDPGLRCVWLDAWDGNVIMGQAALQADVNPPVDHSRQGRSAWIEVLRSGGFRQVDTPMGGEVPVVKRAEDHPVEAFEAQLRSGKFSITAELSPPDSADREDIRARAELLAGLVDAINVPDGSGANCHMSSLASSVLIRELDLVPVMQVSCRDRNRIALQGDLLGASALGVNNVLFVTGDGVESGDHPEAKPVFDLDSISALHTARGMRDEAQFLSSRKLTHSPNLFLGAAANPFVLPYQARHLRLAKKISAGAQFVQTQYCFNLPLLRRYMADAVELQLHKKCFLLVGVGPLLSARSACWIRSHVPGIHIPDSIISRLENARNERDEGIRICVELIEGIREIEGVSGVHLMVHKQEKLLAELVRTAGLR